MEEKAKKVGLQVNEEKIEYMFVGRRDSAAVFPHLKVGRYEISRVKRFKYLGSILTEKNETEKEIASRTLSGNKCLYGLPKILGSRSLSIEMKIQPYVTLIRSVVTCGAE